MDKPVGTVRNVLNKPSEGRISVADLRRDPHNFTDGYVLLALLDAVEAAASVERRGGVPEFDRLHAALARFDFESAP